MRAAILRSHDKPKSTHFNLVNFLLLDNFDCGQINQVRMTKNNELLHPCN